MCISCFVYTVLYLIEQIFKINKIVYIFLNVSDLFFFLNAWELHKLETVNQLLYFFKRYQN